MCHVVTTPPLCSHPKDFLNLGGKRLFFSLRASVLVGELAVGMEGGLGMVCGMFPG